MIPQDVIEELRAKHGAIFSLKAGGYEVVVKAAGRAQYRKFKQMTADPLKRPDSIEGLFRDCVVYPEPKAVEEMLALKPALAEVFGGEVLELAGAAEEVEKNAL